MSQIELHQGQSDIFSALFTERLYRYIVAVCSRGWGKSYCASVLSVAAVFELLQLEQWVPNKNVYIVAPTYAQVTDIYHPLLAYQLGMEGYCIKHSKDLGRFWFPKGVELRLVSYEAIERLRGTGAYFVVLDEVSSWEGTPGLKDAWQGIIQPCINTRWSEQNRKRFGAPSPGRAAIISTPKGYNYLHDMFHFPELSKDWGSFHFDYKTSPYLDVEEIEKLKDTLDPLTFNREYKATFEDSGNQVFYCFDRKLHVRNDLEPLKDGEDVHIGIDFNVGLQCSSVFALRGGQMQFLDEFKGHPDTETLATAIIGRYRDEDKNKNRIIHAYPDPTGRSRKTSAPVGQTDFSILESKGIRTRAHLKAPPIVDSVQAVNRKLLTASKKVDMYVSTKCQGIIQSLERTSWVDNNPNTATIDKTEGIEHYSDGIRYSTEFLFPVLSGTKRVVKGFGF